MKLNVVVEKPTYSINQLYKPTHLKEHYKVLKNYKRANQIGSPFIKIAFKILLEFINAQSSFPFS